MKKLVKTLSILYVFFIKGKAFYGLTSNLTIPTGNKNNKSNKCKKFYDENFGRF